MDLSQSFKGLRLKACSVTSNHPHPPHPSSETLVSTCGGGDCRFEDGALAESFLAMGDKAVGLAHHEHEQSRKLVASFEAPFKVSSARPARLL